jgi:hypothetical protein
MHCVIALPYLPGRAARLSTKPIQRACDAEDIMTSMSRAVDKDLWLVAAQLE